MKQNYSSVARWVGLVVLGCCWLLSGVSVQAQPYGPGHALTFPGRAAAVTGSGQHRGNFTIEFWMKSSGFTLVDEPILCKGVSGWRIQRRDASHNLEYVERREGGLGVHYISLVSSTVVDDGQWHHIRVTRVNEAVELLVDGVSQASQPKEQTAYLAWNTEDLVLGGDSAATSNLPHFGGVIDEVRYWDNVDFVAPFHGPLNDTVGAGASHLIYAWRFDDVSNVSHATNLVVGGPTVFFGASLGVSRVTSDAPLIASRPLLPAGTPLNAQNVTWNRRNPDGTRSGKYVPYRTLRFTPQSSGPHKIIMETVGFAGAIFVYQGGFNPCSSLANIYAPSVIGGSPGRIIYNTFMSPGAFFDVVFSAANTNEFGTFTARVESIAPVTLAESPTNMSIQCGPENRVIVTGTSTTLEVHPTGPAPSAYQWYSGLSPNTSRPIPGATGSRYTTPVLFENTNYWVRILAVPGVTPQQIFSPTATITIAPAPDARSTNVLDAGDCRLADGRMFETVRFHIQEEGNYMVNVTGGAVGQIHQGYFDPAQPLLNLYDQPTTDFPQVMFFPDGDFELVVSKATPVTAVATIGGGPAVAVLLPALPPQILSSPLDTTIRPGETATLTVSTTCGTPRSLQWYRGHAGDTNTPIPGAIGEMFTTPSLTNDTRYWVRMSYAGGSNDSATATVFVTAGPITFTGALTDCDYTYRRTTPPNSVGPVTYYKTFIFRAAVSGQYTFTLNATNFSGAMSLHQGVFLTNLPLVNLYQVSQTNGSPASLTTTLLGGVNQYLLVITSVNPLDTGEFLLTVGGSNLVTRVAGPQILQPPAPVTFAGYGTNATLSVLSDSVGVSYQWFTGSNCPARVAIPGANAASYTTPNIFGASNYWVELRNAGGYVVSDVAVVTPHLAARDDQFSFLAGPLDQCAPGVLANDRNVGVTFSLALVSPPAHGALTLNGDGSFLYTPAVGFTGEDSFTYKLISDDEESLPATARLTVLPALPEGVLFNGPGTSYGLDGTTDRMQVGGGAALNFTEAFTVEFWMRTPAWQDAWEALITKGDTAWRIHRWNTNGALAFDITGLSSVTLGGTRAVADGAWHHVAAVFDGRSKRLYVDGQLDAVATNLTGMPATNTQPVWIGANSMQANRYFRGELDEVRIWNVARCSFEIAANMRHPLTGQEPGLHVYYRFDGTTTGGESDLAGGNNPGTRTLGAGFARTTVTPFTPTLATLPVTAFDPLAWFTALVKENGLSSTAWFEFGTTSYNRATTATAARDVLTHLADDVAADETWYVRAFAENAAGRSAGPEVSFTPVPRPRLSVPQVLGNGAVSITFSNTGASLGLFASTNLTNWQRVATTNLGGLSQLIEQDMATRPRRFYALRQDADHALGFDGANDSVAAPAVVLSNRSFTVETWLRRDTTSRWDLFLSQGTNVTDRGLHIGFRPNNQFTFAFFGNDLNYAPTALDTNWHHWAVSYNSTNDSRRIYLDGVLVAEDFPATAYQGTGPLRFGQTAFVNGSHLRGALDNLRLWTTARTATEIQSTMHAPVPPSAPGLAADYRFDEGVGTITRSTTGVTATLSGNPTWLP